MHGSAMCSGTGVAMQASPLWETASGPWPVHPPQSRHPAEYPSESVIRLFLHRPAMMRKERSQYSIHTRDRKIS